MVALKQAKENFDASVLLSDTAKMNLKWWIGNVQDQVSCIQRDPPTVTITSDSSGTAWGSTRGALNAGGPWGYEDIDWHINLKEVTAAFFTL